MWRISCRYCTASKEALLLFLVLFLFLFITLHGLQPLWCVVDLLSEDIASTFVGRFRWYLHLFCIFFLRKKCTFQRIEQFWELSLGGATIGARMARTKLKIWENGCIPSRSSLARRSSSLPNLTLIGSGVGVYGPKNWKKSTFTNIIAP